MSNFLKLFFGKWWPPMVFLGAGCFTFGLAEVWQNLAFEDFAMMFLGLGLIVILISAVYHFVKRNWLAAIGSLLLFGGTIIALYVYILFIFIAIHNRPDSF